MPQSRYVTLDPSEIDPAPDVPAIVRSVAVELGVDPDLALRVARHESGFNQSARSNKGAIGVMQLMPDTAKDLGVDPEDLDQNIRGGLTHLKAQLDRYRGDVPKALAAYNAGSARVDSGEDLPKETQDYVRAITGRPYPGSQLVSFDPGEIDIEPAQPSQPAAGAIPSRDDLERMELNLAASRLGLDTHAAELVKQATALQQERAALGPNPTPEQLQAFNSKLELHNLGREQFKTRLADFQQGIAGYNAGIQAFNANLQRYAAEPPVGAGQTGLPGVPIARPAVLPIPRTADQGRRGVYRGEPIEEPVPRPGEPTMRDVLQPALTGRLPEGYDILAPKPGDTPLDSVAKGVLQTALGAMSAESLAIMLGASGATNLLRQAANLPKVAKALKAHPQVLKALDVAAATAIPAAFTGLAAKGAVEGGAAAIQAAKKGEKPAATQAAVQTLANLILTGLGTVGAVRSGRAIAEAYPLGEIPASGAPRQTRLRTAVQESQTLGKAGRRLAAQAWIEQAQKIASEDWAKVLGEPVSLELNGKPVTVRYAGATTPTETHGRGTPILELIDDATGKVLTAGDPKSLKSYLDVRGATGRGQRAESTAADLDEAYSQAVKDRAEAQSTLDRLKFLNTAPEPRIRAERTKLQGRADKLREALKRQDVGTEGRDLAEQELALVERDLKAIEGRFAGTPVRDLYAEAALKDAEARISDIQKQRAKLGAEGTQLPKEQRKPAEPPAQPTGAAPTAAATQPEAAAPPAIIKGATFETKIGKYTVTAADSRTVSFDAETPGGNKVSGRVPRAAFERMVGITAAPAPATQPAAPAPAVAPVTPVSAAEQPQPAAPIPQPSEEEQQYARAVEYAKAHPDVSPKALWIDLEIPRHVGLKLIGRMRAEGVLPKQPAPVPPAVAPAPPAAAAAGEIVEGDQFRNKAGTYTVRQITDLEVSYEFRTPKGAKRVASMPIAAFERMVRGAERVSAKPTPSETPTAEPQEPAVQPAAAPATETAGRPAEPIAALQQELAEVEKRIADVSAKLAGQERPRPATPTGKLTAAQRQLEGLFQVLESNRQQRDSIKEEIALRQGPESAWEWAYLNYLDGLREQTHVDRTNESLLNLNQGDQAGHAQRHVSLWEPEHKLAVERLLREGVLVPENETTRQRGPWRINREKIPPAPFPALSKQRGEERRVERLAWTPPNDLKPAPEITVEVLRVEVPRSEKDLTPPGITKYIAQYHANFPYWGKDHKGRRQNIPFGIYATVQKRAGGDPTLFDTPEEARAAALKGARRQAEMVLERRVGSDAGPEDLPEESHRSARAGLEWIDQQAGKPAAVAETLQAPAMTPAPAPTVEIAPEDIDQVEAKPITEIPATPEALAETRPERSAAAGRRPWQMTLEEFRQQPEALAVPRDSVLAVDMAKETPEALQRFSKGELQSAAIVLGVSQSGTKAEIAARLVRVYGIRAELSDATVESLEAKTGAELRRYLDELNLFKGGSKHAQAVAIVNWRNDVRQKGKHALAEAKWIAAIQNAVAAGQEIPADVVQDLKARGKEWALASAIVKGNVETLEETYNLLRNVAGDRASVQTGARHGAGAGEGVAGAGLGAGPGHGAASHPGVRPGEPGTVPAAGLVAGTRPGASDRVAGGVEPGPRPEPAARVERPRPPEGTAAGPAEGPRGGAEDAADQRPLAGTETAAETLRLTREEQPVRVSDEEDSSPYTTYHPSLKGPAHPGAIVETKTMATVPMPQLTYEPHLPADYFTRQDAGLSAVQLEAVAMVGMQNSVLLPGGFRATALIGDGTGVGKGRTAAAILWDNYRQGRKRLVWVSEKWDLMDAAIADLFNIGAAELTRGITQQEGKFVLGQNAAVQPFIKWDGKAKIVHDGILFTTYALIRSEDKKGNRRVGQLEQWLRGDDDGDGAYMLFDEAHNLKNAVAAQGGQESQIGRKIKELLQRMPKLRTASMSATAATDVVNLGYLDRLGMWGPGTAFPNGFGEFQTQVAGGGLSAMELIARELKAQGKYVARTLSYKGVTFEEKEHPLSAEQKELYRTAARAWNVVYDHMGATIAEITNGGSHQRSRAMSQFYGAQLRFFSLLISTLKIPTAIEEANKALAEGKSVVISLINTNEAAQNREKHKLRSTEPGDDEIPDYDFGPKEMLVQYVRDHYPVQQYRDDVDSAGNPIKVPVYRKDEDGRDIPVLNPEAVRRRDELVKQIERDLHMPDNPLDILIESLGGEKKVAEITGRKERFDRTTGKFAPRGDPKTPRKEVNLVEMRAFQSGKKRIAILSSAGGTGISLHAGNDVANRQKRVMITLQVGWSADKQMQMFGRVHRTNQAHPPEYVLLFSDLGGERRFISTISRRLGSLGALTKGQRSAVSGADLMEKVNFETDQGRAATDTFYQALLRDRPIPGAFVALGRWDDAAPENVQNGPWAAGQRVKWAAAGGEGWWYGTLAEEAPAASEADVQVAADDGETRQIPRFDLLAVGERREKREQLTGRQVLSDLHVMKHGADGTEYLPQEDRTNVTRLLNRLLALDPDIQNGVYNFYYDIFQAAVQDAIEKGSLDTGVRTLPGDEFTIKESRVISRDPKTGAETFYYPVDVSVRTHRVSAAELERRMREHAKDNPRILRNEKGRLGLFLDASPIVHASGQVEPAVYYITAADGHFQKAPAYRTRNMQTPANWAASAIESARSKIRSIESDLDWYREQVKRNPANTYMVRSVEENENKLAEQQGILADAEAAAKDPDAWAKQEWARQYEAAPDHETETYHLIGGAVMRFWNPIRESAGIGNNIYTASDSRTGQRVVGVRIPPQSIQKLLARISGGASTVTTYQLYTDVLRNNLSYTLEGGIQVRRGRVGRENVVQIIPPERNIAATLMRMGVLHERGVVPIYYVPEEHRAGIPEERTTYGILSRILAAYPVRPEEPGTGEEDQRDDYGAQPLARPRLLPSPRLPGAAFYQTADAKYEKLLAGRPGHVYLNESARALLQFALEAAGERPEIFDGITLPYDKADLAYRHLGQFAKYAPGPVRQRIDRIREAFVEAERDLPIGGRYLTFVAAGPEVSADEVRKTRKEEEFHRQQYQRNSDPLTHVDAEALKQVPDVEPAYTAAKRQRPGLGDQEIFLEIGATIGTGRWGELGLSADEALAAFRAYYDHVVARHGEQMKGLIHYAHPYLRKAIGETGERIPLRRHREDRGPREPQGPDTGGEGPQRRGAGPALERPRPGDAGGASGAPDWLSRAAEARELRAEAALASRELPGFYSQLERVIEQKMPERAGVGQVRAIVSNPQNGVKPDELKWTGFDDWLVQQGTKPITKADALAFLRANRVEVREILRGPAEPGITGEPPLETRWRRWRGGSLVLPGGEQYREILFTLPAPPYYESQHWSEANVIAHVRFAEHRSTTGERVLLIEEEQSDWHQAGREKGYRPAPPLTQLPSGYQARQYWQPGLNQFAWEVVDPHGNRVSGGNFATEERAVEAALEALNRRGVPAAPFAKTWHELVFRRMLRWAAEHGFDRVAWTTGAQQIDRYESALRQNVDEIEWEQQPTPAKQEPGVRIVARKANSAVFSATVPLEGTVEISGEQASLDDLLGKGMASQIREAIASGDQSRGAFSGENLAIGGEGMKGFYDQILTAYAAKYGKKWGAKLESIALKQPAAKPRTQMPETRFEGRTYLAVVPHTGMENARGHYGKLAARLMARTPAVLEFDPEYQSTPPIDLVLAGEEAVTRTGLIRHPQGRTVYYRRSARQRASQEHRVMTPAEFEAYRAGPERHRTYLAERQAALSIAEARRAPGVPMSVHSIAVTPSMRESVLAGQPLFQREAARPFLPALENAEMNYRRGVLWANLEGMDLLERFTHDRGVRGMHLSRRNAAEFRAWLEGLKPTAAEVARRRIDAIIAAVEQAEDENTSVVVVSKMAFDKLSALKARLRHEETHRVQSALGKPGVREHIDATALLRHPLAEKPILALLGLSYEANSDVLAAEIGAHLAEGPRGWARIGLDRAEAEVLFGVYLDLLAERHGAEAISKLRRIAPQLNEELRRARERAEGEAAGVRRGLGQQDRAPIEGEAAEAVSRAVREGVPAGEESREVTPLASRVFDLSAPPYEGGWWKVRTLGREMQSRYYESRQGRPVILLNGAGYALMPLILSRNPVQWILGHAWMGDSRGMAVSKWEITGFLEWMESDLEGRGESFQQLARTLRQAVDNPRSADGLSIIKIDEDWSDVEVEHVVEHEDAHAAQMALGGQHHWIKPDKFLAHPLAKRAWSKLAAKGYQRGLIGLIMRVSAAWSEADREALNSLKAAEIGARLMIPDDWEDMGLRDSEAAELAKLYVDELIAQHGNKAAEVVERTVHALGGAFEPGDWGPAAAGEAPAGAGEPAAADPGTANERGRGIRGGLAGAYRWREIAGVRRPGTAPRLSDLAGWISRRFGADGPRVNYSGLGALKTKYLRNLSQLEAASISAHTAAIRAASSRAQSATILRAAVPKILETLNGSGYTWPELRLAMIESRLRGIRERWQSFANQVDDMTGEELKESFNEQFASLLDALEGKRGLPQDLAQTAAAIVDRGDWEEMRAFLAQTFDDAAASVSTVMDPAWYDSVTSAPQVQEALRVYKRLVEAPMAENHALNEGVFSDALGPLNTYYPLIAVQRETPAGPGRRLPYHKPRNIANIFATGLAEGYDASMEAFRDRLTKAVRANDKAALLATLEEEGLLVPAERGAETFIGPDGVEYTGERIELSPARLIIQGGKTVHVPARMGLIPKWLHRELRPILEGDRYDTPTIVHRIMSALNTFSLAGPADFVFHTSNLLGTLVANTPFLGTSLKDKLLSLPMVKKFAAVAMVMNTDPTTEQAAADLVEMAKVGLIPDRYASVTFSTRAALDFGSELFGWRLGVRIAGRELILPRGLAPILYGPKGLDIRARVLMYRLAKAINPNATAQELFRFVNQLGNYVPALQGEVERALKSSGWSPFFTAGSTMIRNGINAWTGAGPMPKGGPALRIWQQLTGGAIGLLVLWALTYYAITEEWPWEDTRAKLLQIPAPDSLRRSKLGNALWGRGPEVGYLNFAFFDPLIARGGRAMGLPGAFETHQLRGSAGQSLEAAQRDIINAFAHPALGPIARGVFVGVTGAEAYLTSLRDRQGRIAPSFYPAVPPKTKPGLPALGARMMAAGIELNAFYGAIGEATGMLGEDKGKKGNQWLRMMFDMTLPGLVANASNPYKRAAAIRQQKYAVNQ